MKKKTHIRKKSAKKKTNTERKTSDASKIRAEFQVERRANLKVAQEYLALRSGMNMMKGGTRKAVIAINNLVFAYTFESSFPACYVKEESKPETGISLKQAEKTKEILFRPAFIDCYFDSTRPESYELIQRIIEWQKIKFPQAKISALKFRGFWRISIGAPTIEKRNVLKIPGKKAREWVKQSEDFMNGLTKIIVGK